MPINLKIEGIIYHNISTERNIMNWNEYKNNIIFTEQIENYIHCGKLLYTTRLIMLL